jgi:hypothetical protein
MKIIVQFEDEDFVYKVLGSATKKWYWGKSDTGSLCYHCDYFDSHWRFYEAIKHMFPVTKEEEIKIENMFSRLMKLKAFW